MSKKIVLILSLILIVIVVGLGLWWYLSKTGKLPSPAQLLTQPAEPKGGIINPTPPASTTLATADLPADQRTSEEVMLDNLVRNFAERVGSYSQTTMIQAKQLVANLPVAKPVIDQIITPLPQPWQTVTSRVLKIELIKAEANQKSYQLTVQREWQSISSTAVNYKEILIKLTKQGGNWQITQADWQ